MTWVTFTNTFKQELMLTQAKSTNECLTFVSVCITLLFLAFDSPKLCRLKAQILNSTAPWTSHAARKMQSNRMGKDLMTELKETQEHTKVMNEDGDHGHFPLVNCVSRHKDILHVDLSYYVSVMPTNVCSHLSVYFYLPMHLWFLCVCNFILYGKKILNLNTSKVFESSAFPEGGATSCSLSHYPNWWNYILIMMLYGGEKCRLICFND